MIRKTVSIIIPIFNSEKYLPETLRSITDQSFQDWECLCIDDGSTDSSISIINSYIAIDNRIKLYRRPSHLLKGGNSCRNYGFEKALGQFIQWFDSDDLMHEAMLERKVQILEEHNKINYVICHTAYFNDDNPDLLYPYDQHLKSNNILLDHLTYKTKFFTPGPMFRKTFLIGMELFNITLKRHQEREFFFRVVLKDKKYSVVDDILIFRRMHGEQLSLAANKSAEKTMMKFEVNRLNFNNFVHSKQKSIEVIRYFRDFFFRFTYRLFKERRFKLAITCFQMMIRSLLKRA